MREPWERSRCGTPAAIPVNNGGLTHHPRDSRGPAWRRQGLLQQCKHMEEGGLPSGELLVFEKWRVECRNRGSRWPDFFLVAMVGVTSSLPERDTWRMEHVVIVAHISATLFFN